MRRVVQHTLWCTCWFSVGVDAARPHHHPRSPPSVLGRDFPAGVASVADLFQQQQPRQRVRIYMQWCVCYMAVAGRHAEVDRVRSSMCRRRRRTRLPGAAVPIPRTTAACSRHPRVSITAADAGRMHAPLPMGVFYRSTSTNQHRDPSPRRSFTTFHSAQTCPPWWLQDWQNRAPQWPSHRV